MTKTKNKKTNRNNTNKRRESTVSHHVRRVFHTTPKFVHGMVAGAFVGVMLVGVLRTNGIANATGSSTPDCDANSVIWCGATSPSKVGDAYHNGDGHNGAASIQHIYSWFGITSSAISAMPSDSVAGYVTKGGDVYAGSKLVAKKAITAGRQNIAGSIKEVSSGTIFYARNPSVSFQNSSLTAMVVMKNNVFQFAVLNSCGNPVQATATTKPPTPTPTPKPTPTPTPKPTPTPTPTPPTTPTTPITTITPPPTPVTVQPISTLPNTGPGAVVIIAIASVVGGYVFHMTHRHIRKKRQSGTHHHTGGHTPKHAHAH
jgi:hypothetical protein